MARLPTLASVNGTTLSGAQLKTVLVAIWNALKTAGLSDASRSAITTSSTLLTTQAGLVLVDATSANVTLTLPTSGSDTDDAVFMIRRIDSSGNTVIVQRGGTDTIEGSTGAITIGAGGVAEVQLPAGSTNWRIVTLTGATQAAARAAIGAIGATDVEAVLKSGPTDTVASNALTVVAQAYSLAFRSTTLGSGATTQVTGTPAALVIPSGATLGSVSGQQADYAVAVMNNGGALEYAVANMAGGLPMDETGLISTTAISAAAGAANVWYSNTARSNLPYRLVRVIRHTQAAAGTYASPPSLVQSVGGQAFGSMMTFGVGQTAQDVTGSRVLGTAYFNTTGRTIWAHVVLTASGTGTTATITVTQNGVARTFNGTGQPTSGATSQIAVPVPPGATYQAGQTGTGALAGWLEIR